MIVTREAGSLRLVTQADHARIAGEILGLWRRDGLPDHPRRRDLLLATREHDCGWWEADAAPRVVDGRPLDFREAGEALRHEVRLRSVERLRDTPYAALLVVEHALAIGDGSPSLVRSLSRLREDLLDETGTEPAELAADYRWLHLADAVSLCLCDAWPEIERHGYRCSATDDGHVLDPFPLAGATSFEIPCRTVADRPYATDADLAVELARSRWGDRKARLVPPGA